MVNGAGGDAPPAERPGRLLSGRLLSGRAWLAVHGWLGLSLNVFLLFVLLTGTVATLSHEIEWVFSERARADGPPADGAWENVAAAARQAYPGHAFGYVTAGPLPASSWVVSATRADGAYRRVYVDPFNGRVTGEGPFLTFPIFMRQLHYQLLTSSSIALYAVCALSFVLLGSLLSGLTLSRKFWRGFFRLRLRHGPRILLGDMHRLCGLWSIWFSLVMVVTGVWYLVERGMDEAAGFSVERGGLPSVTIPDGPRPGPPPAVGPGTAVATAQSALPGLRVRSVTLSRAPHEPYVVAGQAGAWLVRDRASRVVVHPLDGTVLQVRRAADMGLAERWAHTADPLHFGDFGGIATKLVWAACGAVMSAMAASGLCIWWKRTAPPPAKGQGQGSARRPAGASRRGLRPWWLANGAAMLLPFAVLPSFVSQYTAGLTAGRPLGEAALGPLTVSAALAEDRSRPVFHLRFCDGCYRLVRQADIRVKLPGRADIVGRLGADPNRLLVALPAPLPPGATVRLTAELWTGGRHGAGWAVSH